MTDESCFFSAHELVRQYRAGVLSPVEVTRAILRHIADVNPSLNAIYFVDADGALAAARASEARWRRGAPMGALDGVPVTLKDSIRVAGMPTPNGTEALAGEPCEPRDSPVTARLREDGAIVLGKTTMPDFGMIASGISSLHGVTRNPWNPARNSGGSSSGAGAAVAAGFGPLAVGSDIGGSVRIPAAFCGIVGLKPSYGRVPIADPWPMLVAGPMARTVTDVALMLGVISRPDASDYTSLPWDDRDYLTTLDSGVQGLRIGLLTDIGFGLPVRAEVRACVEAAAALLAGLGAIVEVMAPIFDADPEPDFDRMLQAYAWADYDALPSARRALVLPEIAAWCENGAGMSAAEFTRAAIAVGHARRRVLAACAQYDYVISPTMAVEPYAAELPWPEGGTQHNPFCFPFNLSEQPALSLCCGFTRSGTAGGAADHRPALRRRRRAARGPHLRGRTPGTPRRTLPLRARDRVRGCPMTSANLLEVRDLRKTFGGVVANDAISIDVPRGAIVGLIGPNGSGKTTLFNSIVGHHPIDGGSVRFEGRELARLGVPEVARLGLLRTFQQAHVYDGMTCVRNMQVSTSHAGERLFAMLRRFPPEVTDKANGLLDFVGLTALRDEVAGNLSYGQRKLLELAMALMNEPKMLLLDEPTAGINPTLINSVIDRLKQANAVARHHAPGHRAQHARHHEPRRAHLLPGARQAARVGNARRDPQRPARHRRLSGSTLMDLRNTQRHGDHRAARSSRGDRRTRDAATGAESADRTSQRAAIRERLDALAGDDPLLRVDGLVAGYGAMEILHGIDLRLGKGQSLCLIGPERRRQVHRPALDLRAHRHPRRPDRGRRPQRDAARPQREAARRRHRLRAAGQLAVPRHDRRAEPVARRLPDGPPRPTRGRRPSGSSTATLRSRCAGTIRRACCPAASAACSRSRARSSCSRACCWSTSRRSVSSRRSSSRSSRCSATSGTAKA